MLGSEETSGFHDDQLVELRSTFEVEYNTACKILTAEYEQARQLLELEFKRRKQLLDEDYKTKMSEIDKKTHTRSRMSWINVGERLPAEGNGSYQLVAHLNPFFGKLITEITIGYFDGPENYDNPEDAEGWKDWHTGNKLFVTHWQKLPEHPTSRFNGIEQTEFKAIFGSFRPKLGSVHEH